MFGGGASTDLFHPMRGGKVGFGRERAREPAARRRADGPARSTRVRLVAERGPCDVRSRVRGERVDARARPRQAELGGKSVRA